MSTYTELLDKAAGLRAEYVAAYRAKDYRRGYDIATEIADLFFPDDNITVGRMQYQLTCLASDMFYAGNMAVINGEL